VVANLRPALTSVGPLLETIRTSLGLSDAAVGLLPTLPLLIFAGLSLFAHFGEAFGIEKTLAWCLALIAAGIALRSQGSIAALFAGTAIFSAGIAVANVLVPSLIKRDFPDHATVSDRSRRLSRRGGLAADTVSSGGLCRRCCGSSTAAART
jgi:MFS transporter, CP family, cyanate transporter